MKKQIANYITCFRILCSFALIPFEPNHIAFYFFYSIAAVSDMLDGMVARKTNSTSRLGATLDSISDLVFFIVTIIKLIPVMLPLLPAWTLCAILIIASIKISAYAVGFLRFHQFVALHTILNKITGAILFVIPYFISTAFLYALLIIATILATIASIEELLCQILMKKCNRDIQSIIEL